MKTDVVRQEDEEEKENERFRDVKKQEEELGKGRQDGTACYGQCETGGYHSGVQNIQGLRDVSLSRRRFELSRCLRPNEHTNVISLSLTFQVTTAATTNPLDSTIE
jgi:hypothetical protein